MKFYSLTILPFHLLFNPLCPLLLLCLPILLNFTSPPLLFDPLCPLLLLCLPCTYPPLPTNYVLHSCRLYPPHFHSVLPTTTKRRSVEPEKLLDPDFVVNKYTKLKHVSNIGRLAVRLACESYFGKELLMKSTVYGCQDKPPLPKEEMAKLKYKLISIHP